MRSLAPEKSSLVILAVKCGTNFVNTDNFGNDSIFWKTPMSHHFSICRPRPRRKYIVIIRLKYLEATDETSASFKMTTYILLTSSNNQISEFRIPNTYFVYLLDQTVGRDILQFIYWNHVSMIVQLKLNSMFLQIWLATFLPRTLHFRFAK